MHLIDLLAKQGHFEAILINFVLAKTPWIANSPTLKGV